jgi:hypothetical protein
MNRILLIIEIDNIELVEDRLQKWLNECTNKNLIKGLKFKLILNDNRVFVLSNNFNQNYLLTDLLLYLREYECFGKKIEFELFFIRDNEGKSQFETSKLSDKYYSRDNSSTKLVRDILINWYEEEFIEIEIESLNVIKYDIKKAFGINDKKKLLEEKKNNAKGFKITFILTVIISLINLYINYYYYIQYYEISSWIGLAIITFSIIIFEKMLKDNLIYAFLLLIMLLYFTIPYALAHETSYFWITGINNIANIIPLFFLLINRPLRLIFLKVNGYEPIFDRYSTMANSLYSLLNIMIPLIKAFYIF